MNVSLTTITALAQRPAFAAPATAAPSASPTAPRSTSVAGQSAQQSFHGAGLVAGANEGSASGGGFSLGRINIGKVITLAGLGAMAAMVMPPLAPIGAIGGAIAGVILSLIA